MLLLLYREDSPYTMGVQLQCPIAEDRDRWRCATIAGHQPTALVHPSRDQGTVLEKVERHRTMADITLTETLHVPVLLKRTALECVFDKNTWTSFVGPAICEYNATAITEVLKRN